MLWEGLGSGGVLKEQAPALPAKALIATGRFIGYDFAF